MACPAKIQEIRSCLALPAGSPHRDTSQAGISTPSSWCFASIFQTLRVISSCRAFTAELCFSFQDIEVLMAVSWGGKVSTWGKRRQDKTMKPGPSFVRAPSFGNPFPTPLHELSTTVLPANLHTLCSGRAASQQSGGDLHNRKDSGGARAARCRALSRDLQVTDRQAIGVCRLLGL